MKHWKPITALAMSLGLAAVACDAGDGAGDESGPVKFIDLRVEDVASARAVVKFDTSRETTCEAQFGVDMADLSRSATDPDMEPGTFAHTHRVPLEDLQPETTYYYRARAETPDGEVFTSDVLSFTTLEAGEGTDLYENVALLTAGTRVEDVSSNWSGGANDSSFGANMALDDKMGTAWSSDGDGDDAWIELDFGQERHLVQFGFRSRDMTDGTSIIEQVELLFDDGTRMGPFDTPDSDVRYIFDITPIDATGVRLDAIKTTGGNTGAREIQFYQPR